MWVLLELTARIMGICGWLLLPALMVQVRWDFHWRYHVEELIGRLHEGLWLAASACPYGSSMLQLSRVILGTQKARVLQKGTRDRSVCSKVNQIRSKSGASPPTACDNTLLLQRKGSSAASPLTCMLVAQSVRSMDFPA